MSKKINRFALAVILLFSFFVSMSSAQAEGSPAGCSKAQLGKLQDAVTSYYDGSIINGAPALANLRTQLVATKKDCGGISFDPRSLTDEQLQAKVRELRGQDGLQNSRMASTSLRSKLSACFLFINLMCPDPKLTGSEALPEIEPPSISTSRPAGQALAK